MPHEALNDDAQWRQRLTAFVRQSIELERLAWRVTTVMAALPTAVLCDLLDDPSFRLALEQHPPGGGTHVFMAVSGRDWSGSRSVILRRRLADCAEDFAHYVIAHEFAHAHLRNGPWGEILDPEAAADALAATWGFERHG